MAQTNDNSGMGVVLGILVAVILAIGGYFFIQSQGGVGDTTTTTNIEAPDVTIEPAGGDAPSTAPAQPAQ